MADEVVVDPAGRKLCRVCAYEIPASAIKCTECNSYQNWRRYLDFSSTALSLVIALISVLTVAVPVFKDRLADKKAIVNVRASGFISQIMTVGQFAQKTGYNQTPSDEIKDEVTKEFRRKETSIVGIHFLITNDGEAPAVVTDIVVSGLSIVPSGKRSAEAASRFKLVENDGQYGPVVIQSKSVKSLVGYYGNYSSYGPLLKNDATPVEIEVAATVLGPDGSFKNLRTKQSAPSDQYFPVQSPLP